VRYIREFLSDLSMSVMFLSLHELPAFHGCANVVGADGGPVTHSTEDASRIFKQLLGWTKLSDSASLHHTSK
jgi:hypothetical protein